MKKHVSISLLDGSELIGGQLLELIAATDSLHHVLDGSGCIVYDAVVLVHEELGEAPFDVIFDKRLGPLVIDAEILDAATRIQKHVGVLALQHHRDGSVRSGQEQLLLCQVRVRVARVTAEISENK